MNSIYLIKENGQWKQLSRKQFSEFIKSNDSEGRYFARLPKDIGKEGANIIYETDEKQFAAWRVEKRHFQYLRDVETEKGYIVIPYSELISKNIPVPDETDLLETIIKRANDNEIKDVVSSLDPDERKLIIEMFFKENKTVSCRNVAKRLHINHTKVIRKRNKIFKKIRIKLG